MAYGVNYSGGMFSSVAPTYLNNLGNIQSVTPGTFSQSTQSTAQPTASFVPSIGTPARKYTVQTSPLAPFVEPVFQTSPAMQKAEDGGFTFVRTNPRATDISGSSLFDLSSYYIDPSVRDLISVLRGTRDEDYTIVENPETSTVDIVDAGGRVVGSSTPTLVPLPPTPPTSGGGSAAAPAPTPAPTPAPAEAPMPAEETQTGDTVVGRQIYEAVLDAESSGDYGLAGDLIREYETYTGETFPQTAPEVATAPPPEDVVFPEEGQPTEDFADITTYGVDLGNIFDRQPELSLPEVVTAPEPVATPEPTPEPVATPEPSEDIGTGDGRTGLGELGLGLAGMLTGFGALTRQPSITDTLTTPAMDRFRITAELLPVVEPLYRR